MSNDNRRTAADYIAALTEREYAQFIATARAQPPDQGEEAAMREYAAKLFRPDPHAGWDMSTIFSTDTDK